MGAPHYTPQELQTAAQIYAETGSYTKAAEAIGRDVSGIRDALIRHGAVEVNKSDLHAAACARGIRRARKRLAEVIKIGGSYIRLDQDVSAGLEPKDFAAVANAMSKAIETLLNVDRHREHIKELAARAERTKAEAELAAKKATGELPEAPQFTLDRAAMRALLKAEFGHEGAPDRPGESDRPGEHGPDPVPVPDA